MRRFLGFSGAVLSLTVALQAQAATGKAAATRTEDEIPSLVQDLKSEDQNIRAEAAFQLGLIGSGSGDAVRALVRTLRDPEAEVRKQAVLALGFGIERMGRDAEDAVPDLRQALRHRSVSVRMAAAQALQKINTPEALSALNRYQQEEAVTSH